MAGKRGLLYSSTQARLSGETSYNPTYRFLIAKGNLGIFVTVFYWRTMKASCGPAAFTTVKRLDGLKSFRHPNIAVHAACRIGDRLHVLCTVTSAVRMPSVSPARLVIPNDMISLRRSSLHRWEYAEHGKRLGVLGRRFSHVRDERDRSCCVG